jgi:chromate transporter
MGSVIVIALRSIKDIPALLIAVAALLVLIYMKKIKEPVIIFLAATIGIIIKLII